MSSDSHLKAIALLEKIFQNLGPSYAAYLVLPNVILTLSGLRPFGDGVFWQTESHQSKHWQKDIDTLFEELKKHTSVLFHSVHTRGKDPQEYVSYNFMLKEGLDYCLKQTQLISASQKEKIFSLPSDDDIQTAIKNALGKSRACAEFSEEQLNDCAIGILLGYPDKAIVGSAQVWQRNNPFEPQLVSANIRGASYYVCPQPVYSYPRDLFGDPSILKHEEQWSLTLQNYYLSEFHKNLETQHSFIDKMKELGNFS